MKQKELAEILTVSAALSKTTLGEGDALAWWELPDIRRLDPEKAREAVRVYYQQNDRPMKPVHLIQYAKSVDLHRGGGFFGEPGEIICPKCRGVHHPHEDCSVLIPMPDWFRTEVRRRTGKDPAKLFTLPPDVQDLEGY